MRTGYMFNQLTISSVFIGMQNSSTCLSRNCSGINPSRLRITTKQLSFGWLALCSQIGTGSLVIFPEKVSKVKGLRGSEGEGDGDHRIDIKVVVDKREEHKHQIDMMRGGDEKSDLLGYVVLTGKLVLDKRKTSKSNTGALESLESDKQEPAVDAKLSSKALVWGDHMLSLDDMISVSYHAGLRYFTVHSYPLRKASFGLSCLLKTERSRKDLRFIASNPEEAVRWVCGFADQQCFVNCLPHPLLSSKKQASQELVTSDTPFELQLKCKSPPKMLVILNPRSGRGRSSKIFHDVVEPIFKLAGFRMEVVRTSSAGHARKIAANVDFSSCPDGIICVGGDGVVNEVLNGLLSRDDQKEAISMPIGIIPAGSDNSLILTVLGVKDPTSAAIAIVKGGLTATDVFAVEWIQTGAVHFGLTVSYFGFVCDVLELSEKYQKRFGPLRYFVAGALKFLCLPKYSFEVEYLPASKEASNEEGKTLADREVVDMSDLYTDIMRKSNTDDIPRASSLSSIDSIVTPSHGPDLDTTSSSTHANTEPSKYVRGLDPKSKRLSFGRTNVVEESEVLHPQPPLSATPNWRRTRSKSKTDKIWSGLTATNDPSRYSWGNATTQDKEDISSTISDPGPIWDAEPKYVDQTTWDVENPIELPGPSDDVETGMQKKAKPGYDDKWVTTQGPFLGILVCNHSCKTVQSFQVVAPKAVHDDNNLDLLLVHGSGRFRLLRFFLLLQLGRHLSLPYVEYIKVKAVKIKSGNHTQSGCGIDGELIPVNGQVMSSLLPDQCRLIGRSPNSHNE